MSSGSRCSDNVVNPTRSRKSTDTSRRSMGAVGPLVLASTSGIDPASATAKALPHSPQNLPAAGFAAPHTGHTRASAEPHSMQNLRPASLTVPHASQFTDALSSTRHEPTADTPAVTVLADHTWVGDSDSAAESVV